MQVIVLILFFSGFTQRASFILSQITDLENQEDKDFMKKKQVPFYRPMQHVVLKVEDFDEGSTTGSYGTKSDPSYEFDEIYGSRKNMSTFFEVDRTRICDKV